MKILFIDPAIRFLEKSTYMRGNKPFPHMGLIYLATCAKEAGHEVKFIDMELDCEDWDDLEAHLKKTTYDVAAITSSTFSISDAFKSARLIKQHNPRCITVIGGAHASASPEHALSSPSMDIAIRGEGELVFTELLRVIEKGIWGPDDLKKIQGVVFKDGDKTIDTGEAELNNSLETLPFPDWEIANYDKYTKFWDEKAKEHVNLYQLSASRGCPFKCSFCYPLLGRAYRRRTPESILSEVQYLVDRFGATNVEFTDSTASFHKEQLKSLCHQFIESGLSKKVSWRTETRVDLVDYELLKLMHDAGCLSMYYGIESGDDRVLSFTGKKITVKRIIDAVRFATEAKLKVKSSFIIGHPSETVESARNTLELALYLRKEFGIDLYLNYIDVYPNTKFYNYVEQGHGGLRWIPEMRNNWDKISRSYPSVEVNDLTAEIQVELIEEYTKKIESINPKLVYS